MHLRDQAGETMHNINRAKEHWEETRRLFSETKEKRDAEVAEAILDRDFDDGETKEIMREVFAGGLDNIDETYKTVRRAAWKEYEDLINYDYYKNYIPQGVGLMEFGDKSSRRLRVSNNERWYIETWKRYGKKPNLMELYDVAEREIYLESTTWPEESQIAFDQAVKAAKAKLRLFDELDGYMEDLDKSDMAARTLLTEDGYNHIYKPVLESLMKGNEAVQRAAKDSALLYARMADNFGKLYKIPAVNIAAMLHIGGQPDGYSQPPMYDVRRAGTASLGEALDKIIARRKAGKAANKIKYTGMYGIIYPESNIMHAVNKHNLSRDELNDIEIHVKTLTGAAVSNWSKGAYTGEYGGTAVIGRVDGDLSSYYVCLEFAPNGDVYFKTAAKGSENGINKRIEAATARRQAPFTSRTGSAGNDWSRYDFYVYPQYTESTGHCQ